VTHGQRLSRDCGGRTARGDRAGEESNDGEEQNGPYASAGV